MMLVAAAAAAADDDDGDVVVVVVVAVKAAGLSCSIRFRVRTGCLMSRCCCWFAEHDASFSRSKPCR